MVPCVVDYPSPPRPCGSLSCGSMCRGLSLPPPSVCQGERPGFGGVHTMGGVWGGPATRRRGTIYIFMCIRIYATYLYLVV